MDNSIPLVINDEDLPFEEEILRNPNSLRPWLRYIHHKKKSSKNVINLIYERALKQLPGSYKIWYSYLKVRRSQVRGRIITDPFYEELNNAYERSLVFMHKMPRIWMDYTEFLTYQRKITRTRRVFDRALRALPITQHNRIWPLYIKFVRSHDRSIMETGLRIFRRYMKLSSENAEDFVDYLIDVDKLDGAAVLLAKIVNNSDFVSKKGKSSYVLWNDLCKLVSENPNRISSLNVDAIIRSGLRKYTDQVGRLWCSLADYYIRSGLFERARDIYEEAVQTVTNVRDFSQVFDAYSQFEELVISKMMERIKKEATVEDEDALELNFARYDDLIERRPLLLNSVLLRQNPHNVAEWMKRVTLLEGKPKEIVEAYTEAVTTIDPKAAVGKLHQLWIGFAKFYENKNQLNDAKIIFEKATAVGFLKVEDLASVWCEWAEMELRHGKYEDALKLLRKASAPPPQKISYFDSNESVQMRLHKCIKVWSLYADLEESFGTFESTKSVYDQILDLKIASPQIVINYGLFLKENNYFENAFRAYERGVGLFKWPNVFDIWNTYLTEFLERYGGSKLERARDLFEQCLETCPETYSKPIYLLYAKLEENHGMARHAMSIYDRAVSAVSKKEQFGLFNIYLKKAAEIYGVTRTRSIYEKAIEVLQDKESILMCIRFAELETKLGEVDRARAIYGHCSQMCDPRSNQDFWTKWKDFEVKHGNEDTLREMLRIKRSVQHSFNTQINIMSAAMADGDQENVVPTTTNVDSMSKLDESSSLPVKSSGTISFVSGETQNKAVEEGTEINPDEINLDADEESEEGEDEEEKAPKTGVEVQFIPSQVYGGLKKDDN